MAQPKRELNKKTVRFRRWFYFVSLLIVSLVVCTVLSLTVLFKIENIHVQGISKYKEEEIIKSSHIQYGANLFSLDSKKISSNISMSLPYIEDVTIEKKIPSNVVIKVNEAIPLALVKIPNSYIMISDRYKVLDNNSDLVEGLCIINGLEPSKAICGQKILFENEETSNTLASLIDILKEYSLSASEIDISDLSRTSFLYEGRINVILGFPEKIDYKIKTAANILKDHIKQQEKGTLDLSLILENEHTYFTPN